MIQQMAADPSSLPHSRSVMFMGETRLDFGLCVCVCVCVVAETWWKLIRQPEGRERRESSPPDRWRGEREGKEEGDR